MSTSQTAGFSLLPNPGVISNGLPSAALEPDLAKSSKKDAALAGYGVAPAAALLGINL